jgi:hypothetical protein
MNIDNLNIIKELLTFDKEHDFYFLQIIQRKKDHPEGTVVGSNNSSRLIKAYYIYSVEQLDKYWKEITMLCELFQARACINLNRRNATDVSLLMLSRLADNIRSNHPESSAALFNTVCGEARVKEDRSWIIDVDHKNRREINEVIVFIDKLEPVGDKFITLLETKNGFHIITKPFNLEKFQKVYQHDIHKNNPVNLYIP